MIKFLKSICRFLLLFAINITKFAIRFKQGTYSSGNLGGGGGGGGQGKNHWKVREFESIFNHGQGKSKNSFVTCAIFRILLGTLSLLICSCISVLLEYICRYNKVLPHIVQVTPEILEYCSNARNEYNFQLDEQKRKNTKKTSYFAE